MIPVESAIAGVLKGAGFAKKSRTWRRRTTDFAIQVVNLQRGFGQQLYVNLGVYVAALGDHIAPREELCHVRARLEQVCPDEYFEPVRSLEADSPPQRQALEALQLHGIAWLERLSTKAGLCEFVASAAADRVPVVVAARKLCLESHHA